MSESDKAAIERWTNRKCACVDWDARGCVEARSVGHRLDRDERCECGCHEDFARDEDDE